MKSILSASLCLSAMMMAGTALASPLSMDWPSRNSKIVCGGSVDKQELDMKVVIPGEVMKAETRNGRVLLYVDIHKPGQVRWVMNDGMSDQEYAQREALLSKLTPEEIKLLKVISSPRQMDMQAGLTEGFVNLLISSGERSISISCQEVPL